MDKYLKPGEILEAHPELSELWTPQDIGYLRKLGFVDGYKIQNKQFIRVEDVLEVANYLKQRKKKKKK